MNIRHTLILLFILIVTGTNMAAAEGATTLVRARIPRGAGAIDITIRGIDILAANRDGTYDMVVTEDQLDWLRSGSMRVDILARPMLGAVAELDENLGAAHAAFNLDRARGTIELASATFHTCFGPDQVRHTTVALYRRCHLKDGVRANDAAHTAADTKCLIVL